MTSNTRRLAFGLAVSGAMAIAAPTYAADAGKGATLVQARCNVCHSPEAGQGPDLAGVVGRKAGSLAGFPYSPAMKASKLTWTTANLDTFLADPNKRVPGTSMPNPVVDAGQRADIIAYLATLKP
jgi:cytochrome c